MGSQFGWTFLWVYMDSAFGYNVLSANFSSSGNYCFDGLSVSHNPLLELFEPRIDRSTKSSTLAALTTITSFYCSSNESTLNLASLLIYSSSSLVNKRFMACSVTLINYTQRTILSSSLIISAEAWTRRSFFVSQHLQHIKGTSR